MDSQNQVEHVPRRLDEEPVVFKGLTASEIIVILIDSRGMAAAMPYRAGHAGLLCRGLWDGGGSDCRDGHDRPELCGEMERKSARWLPATHRRALAARQGHSKVPVHCP